MDVGMQVIWGSWLSRVLSKLLDFIICMTNIKFVKMFGCQLLTKLLNFNLCVVPKACNQLSRYGNVPGFQCFVWSEIDVDVKKHIIYLRHEIKHRRHLFCARHLL